MSRWCSMYSNTGAIFFFVVCVSWFASQTHRVEGAKILGVFHIAAYSHYQLGDKIFKELAARGHEVTVVSPYVEKSPPKNFKQIILTGFIEKTEELKKDLFSIPDLNFMQSLIWLNSMGEYLTESTLSHPNVQQLLNKREHYDLVIIPQFVNEAFKGFCYHFKAPCVLINPTPPNHWCNPQMGNPEPPSYVPDTTLNYVGDMNFLQRLHNTLVYTISELYFHLVSIPKHNALLAKYFPDVPHLYDLHYNASLMLVNGHLSVNAPIPLVPNIIDIAGYHVNPPKALPKDLQDYLDSSKNGVIYFSMGSNLKSKNMPKEKVDAILRSFGKLKENVLWKWEDENLPNKPPNVKIAKWLPQQDILAHPNVKLFISHGGFLSTIETVYNGVPVLGIPVFGDQESNMANAELSGYGIKISYKTFTEEKFSAALTEILTNPKYTENVKMRSKVMHDQPQKPLDRAMFWIEYVIRHNGAPHLSIAGRKLPWYQYLLVDVVLATVLAILFVSYITIIVVKRIIKTFCRNDESKNKLSKKNK